MVMTGKKGFKKTREKVIKELKKWSGKLIEPAYTKNISSTIIRKKLMKLVLHHQLGYQNLKG